MLLDATHCGVQLPFIYYWWSITAGTGNNSVEWIDIRPRKWCWERVCDHSSRLDTIIICELSWQRPKPQPTNRVYQSSIVVSCSCSSQHVLTFVRYPVTPQSCNDDGETQRTATNNQPSDCQANPRLAGLHLVRSSPSYSILPCPLFFLSLCCLLPGLLINFFYSPVLPFFLNKSKRKRKREYKININKWKQKEHLVSKCGQPLDVARCFLGSRNLSYFFQQYVR